MTGEMRIGTSGKWDGQGGRRGVSPAAAANFQSDEEELIYFSDSNNMNSK